MPIQSKPSTDAYRAGWDRIFGDVPRERHSNSIQDRITKEFAEALRAEQSCPPSMEPLERMLRQSPEGGCIARYKDSPIWESLGDPK